MLKFQNPVSKPVKHYWFDITESNGNAVRLQSVSLPDLYRKCCEQGYDEGDYESWRVIAEHKMCLELPAGLCSGSTDGDQRYARVTFDTIRGYLLAINATALTKLSGKRVHVSQAEADRRAEICYRCTHRAPVSCSGCHGFLALANIFVQGREFVHLSELGDQSCKVCGCFLLPTIWASKEVLEKVDKNHLDQFREPCWRKALHEK